MDAFEKIMKMGINPSKVNVDRLYTLSQAINPDLRKTAEIIMYLQGQLDIELLPKTSNKSNYPEATIKSYNFFTDIVSFTYTEHYMKFFKTQEDADKFVATGSAWGLDYKSSATDGYEIKGIHAAKRTSSCSKDSWINGD